VVLADWMANTYARAFMKTNHKTTKQHCLASIPVKQQWDHCFHQVSH